MPRNWRRRESARAATWSFRRAARLFTAVSGTTGLSVASSGCVSIAAGTTGPLGTVQIATTAATPPGTANITQNIVAVWPAFGWPMAGFISIS